jgi:Mrp family chromosome partitioning ATPase
VSGQRGDGKTLVAANTALAAARRGNRVLVVDADFATQRLSSLLLSGEEPVLWNYQSTLDRASVGLTDFGAPGTTQLSDVVKRTFLGEGMKLDLLSRGSGHTSASDFFASNDIPGLFEAIRTSYDLVVIDTPPLTQVAYAGEFVQRADWAIVVVSHGGNVAPVEQVADRLSILDVEAAGYVFNRVPLTDERGRSDAPAQDRLGAKSGPAP